MAKKVYLIILLIIAIFIIYVSCIHLGLLHTTFEVGNTNFNMPNGYYEGLPNIYNSDVNITNGTNSIFLSENEDNDIMKHINIYKKYITSQNQTINISNTTIDNTIIYKTYNKDNLNTTHYFFVKNGKTYDVYTWDGNKNMDNIVIDLVKS